MGTEFAEISDSKSSPRSAESVMTEMHATVCETGGNSLRRFARRSGRLKTRVGAPWKGELPEFKSLSVGIQEQRRSLGCPW